MIKNKSNQLRIIGGRWRGRKLVFPDVEGLRPTPDRVRETLFNWLAPIIHGSRCLDLFAGSGALGFEALSRGANELVFIDSHTKVVRQLEEDVRLLKSEGVSIIQQEVEVYLQGAAQPFDIVFIDPPYHSDLVGRTLQRLAHGWVKLGSRVYFELAVTDEEPVIPQGWEVLREKIAGQVAYRLLEVVQ